MGQRALLGLLAVFLAGCSGTRGSGGAAAPQPTTEEMRALYYSDLGPATVDVSAYPEAQKANYKVYAEVCSRCHTLARSINAPTVSRSFWEFYMLGMRARNRFRKFDPITKEEKKAILDFLDYDSRVRKVARKKEFNRSQEALKRRFEPVIEEHLRKLQESNPKVLPQ